MRSAHVLFSMMLLAACSGETTSLVGEDGGGGAGTGAGGTINPPQVSSAVVDTDQGTCFTSGNCGACPATGGSAFGQDAQYEGYQPSYTDNGDGTVTDNVTGLMWQQNPGAKMSYDQAVAGAASFDLAGYTDWRLPTIKEMYSLIVFSGRDVSGCEDEQSCDLVPFIDTDYFVFEYGDTTIERLIDAQYVTSTKYVSTTMNGDETVFGVNLADGRIKGYPMTMMGSDKLFFVQYVRGNVDYGDNAFVDNGDGTVSDEASGLMWTKSDSGSFSVGNKGDGGLDWEQAIAWCEGLSHAGHDDWRLPNAKELQSIVDYSRAPATSSSAALDPIFDVSSLEYEGGTTDFPFYWSSTTHAQHTGGGQWAVYVAFGTAYGWMKPPSSSDYQLFDVHGAGAQRSDPKTGSADAYPNGHGPQGDVVRVYNHARCVRAGNTKLVADFKGDECGSGGSGGNGGGGAGGMGGGPPMPTSCNTQSDCEVAGACPPDAAKGCKCAPIPQGGSACIPACQTPADCPAPPPGQSFSCNPEGLCVPG